jgi:hypothetical protein
MRKKKKKGKRNTKIQKTKNTKILENTTCNKKWTQCDKRKNGCVKHMGDTLRTNETLQKKYASYLRRSAH